MIGFQACTAEFVILLWLRLLSVKSLSEVFIGNSWILSTHLSDFWNINISLYLGAWWKGGESSSGGWIVEMTSPLSRDRIYQGCKYPASSIRMKQQTPTAPPQHSHEEGSFVPWFSCHVLACQEAGDLFARTPITSWQDLHRSWISLDRKPGCDLQGQVLRRLLCINMPMPPSVKCGLQPLPGTDVSWEATRNNFPIPI